MSKEFVYNTHGTCSRQLRFLIDHDVIEEIQIIGGCDGNLKGIKSLITGLNVHEVIDKLEGIRCGTKNTSCPDQIAKALKEYLSSHA